MTTTSRVRPLLAPTALFLLFFLPNLTWALCNGGACTAASLPAAAASALVIAAPYWSAGMLLCRAFPHVLSSALILTLAAAGSFLSAVAIGHRMIYSHGMTPGSFYVLFNSNVSESMNYVQLYLDAKVAVAMTGFFAAQGLFTWLFLRHARELSSLSIKQLVYIALPGVLGYFLFIVVPEEHRMLEQYGFAYREFSYDENYLRIMTGRRNRKPAVATRTAQTAARETYVLVIGESAARSHMGLYGYARNTTPRLCARRNELAVFRDVLSADYATVYSMVKMLTFANHQDMSPAYGDHLIGLMKAAGFTTFWITNQKESGGDKRDIWGKYFSSAADFKIYLNTHELLSPLDEVVLPPFQSAVAQGADKKFVIVHLLGSHIHAGNRYPPTFRQFSTSRRESYRGISERTVEYINHYDNSMLYTDYVLDRLIDSLSRVEGAKMLLYLSDHSDQLGEHDDFLGRSQSENSTQYEIPFLVWFSPEFRQWRRQFLAPVDGYLDRPYQADDLIHSYLDLCAVTTPMFAPARSVFNGEFRTKKRVIKVDHTKPLLPKSEKNPHP